LILICCATPKIKMDSGFRRNDGDAAFAEMTA